MQIQDAVALVTGANGGIGKHYVQGLLSAGVKRIYAGARSVNALEEIVAIDPNRIVPIALDITDASSVNAAATECQDVTLLINNAGVGFNQRFLTADLAKMRSEIEVNYFGMFLMCRAFAPVLNANGGGAIVNMLTILAKVNFPLNASYSASKAAALSLTEGMRAELANQGTLVVAVMPGTVDTDMSKAFPPPKVAPEAVVGAALEAVIDGVEEVYPGEQAQTMKTQLLTDPKAVEKWMATTVANQE